MYAVDIVRWGVWLAWHICKEQHLVDFDFEYDELDLLVVDLSLGSMNGTEICGYETVQSLISLAVREEVKMKCLCVIVASHGDERV